MITRFAFRILSWACWWLALSAAVMAWRDQNELGSTAAWVAAAVLVAAGAAMWKGGEE